MPQLRAKRHGLVARPLYLIALPVLASLAVNAQAWAGECTIDRHLLDRGETRPFLVCGEEISSEYDE